MGDGTIRAPSALNHSGGQPRGGIGLTAASPPPLRGFFPIVIRRKPVVVTLAIAVVLLTLLSLAGQISKYYFGYPTVYGLVTFFYLDYENNLPTWYQSVNLLFCAVLLAGIAVAVYRTKRPFGWHWFGLAVIFVLLSLDETGSLHERTIEPLQRLTGRPTGIWAPTWIFLGFAVVGAVGYAYRRFFFHLPAGDRRQVAVAALLFLFGAIGLEMTTGGLAEGPVDKETFGYALMATLEEFVEMVGVLVFVDYLLRRISREPGFVLSTTS